MLTPEQIEAYRDQFGKIADPINDYLLRDIARRISEAGQLTSTAAYQMWRMQNLGKSQAEVKKELKKLLKTSNKEIERLLTQSAEVGYNFDIKNLPHSEAVSFAENEIMQRIVAAAVELAQEDFTNITQTLGMVDPYGNALPLQKVYRSCTDFAFKQVITGATDYNTAIRGATKNLAEHGVQVIDYESGVRTSLEAAIRRNIMGGLGLMQEQISQQNHDDLGADGWELSAHANSAPDHEPIQGKQYTDAEYEALNNSLRRRIGTLNCGHVAFPIILGVNKPQYTKAELEKFRTDNEEGVTVDGKHYTGYEATQMQRKLERAIRKQKRRVSVDEAAGDEKKLLTDRIKLQRYKQEYARFSKAAGLRTDHERLHVAKASSPKEKSQSFGVGSPKAPLTYINSNEYKKKFDSISENRALNEAIYTRCKAAVTHQSGDYFEDLSVLAADGTLVGTTSGTARNETHYTPALKKAIEQYPEYSLVSVHNHGTNVPPSGADLTSAGSRKYAFGVVACNDGKVYIYDIKNASPFSTYLYDMAVDKYRRPPYNMGEVEAYEAALSLLERDYGVKWRKL